MSHNGKAFLYSAPWLAMLAEEIYFDTTSSFLVEFQCGRLSINEARAAITRTFELTEPWKKQYNEACKWWEYTNVAPNGLPLKLYGDTEGPQSCKKIEVSETVWEDVPVQFEKRKVTRKTVHWECPEDNNIGGTND